MTIATASYKKFQVTAAACAVAAAAVLTPAVIANAEPGVAPMIPSSPMTELFGTDPILGPVQLSVDTPWWWLGDSQNTAASSSSLAPLAVTGTTIFDFQPLALIPGFLQPIGKFFLQFIPQVNVCFFGLGVQIGPYGRVTVRTGAC